MSDSNSQKRRTEILLLLNTTKDLVLSVFFFSLAASVNIKCFSFLVEFHQLSLYVGGISTYFTLYVHCGRPSLHFHLRRFSILPYMLTSSSEKRWILNPEKIAFVCDLFRVYYLKHIFS